VAGLRSGYALQGWAKAVLWLATLSKGEARRHAAMQRLRMVQHSKGSARASFALRWQSKKKRSRPAFQRHR
jgi:hypothetical protein